MEIDRLWVSLAVEAADYARGLSQATNDGVAWARNWGSQVSGVLSAAFKAGLVGLIAVAGIFATIGAAAFILNAQLETSTLQFETLMGDADAAKAHVEALFEFAKSTPFETQPIIDASRMMQTFGGSALNTMDNLRLVGDAAAATNAPINDVAFWVGRMYAALQAGKPIGEAVQNLSQLAVISPQAALEMERLMDAGASADEVFAAFQEDLGRFTGAMEKQAGTWDGLMSTISDALKITAATALEPFFDLAKTGLAGLATFLSGDVVANGAALLAEKISLIGTVVGLFIDRIQGGMPILDALQILLTQIELVFGLSSTEARALGERFTEIVIQIQGFITEVQNLLEPVMTAVTQFVSWNDVLTAFGIILAAVIIPGLISAAISLAAFVAPILLLIGLVALLRTAWEENWGGIQEKVQGVADWFTIVAIPAVIQFGADIQTWIVDTAIPAFTALSAWFDEHGQTILAVLAAIGVVLAAIAASAIVAWIGSLIAAFTAFGGVSQLVMMGFWAIYAAVGALGSILAVILSPIGLVVAAVALLAAAWVADFGGIRDFFSQIWLSIQQVWESFKLLFQGDFEGFTAGLKTAWETAWTAVTTFLGNLWAMAQPHLVALWTGITTWVAGIDWAKIGRDIVTFVTNGLNTFVAFVASTLASWHTAFTAWVGNIDWEKLGYDIVTFILDALIGFPMRVVATLAEWYTAFTTWQSSQDWEQISENTIDRIIEALTNFVNLVGPTLAGWYTSFTTWFAEQDWKALATSIIDGLVSGLVEGVGALAGAMTDIAEGAKQAWDDFWNSHSPSLTAAAQAGDVVDGYVGGLEAGIPALAQTATGMGNSVATALIGAIEANAEDAQQAMQDVLSLGSTFSDLGNTAVQRFTAEVLDPIQEQMDGMESSIDALLSGTLQDAMRRFGVDSLDSLVSIARLAPGAFSGAEVAALQEAAALEAERLELAEQYAAEQERVLELQKQQADLQFLQQQLDLLNTIREAGLNPADVLGGMTLGLDASLPDLIEAMSGAMQAIIAAAEGELQIASPSGVFEEIFRQVGAGAAQGLGDSESILERAARRMGAATYEPFLGVGAGAASPITNHNQYDTSIQVAAGADPMRWLRTSRHLDNLGAVA